MTGVLTKRKTVVESCRKVGICETTFARWREQALEGMDAALIDKDTRNSREDVLAQQLAEAERRVGRLVLENDLLGKASRRLT